MIEIGKTYISTVYANVQVTVLDITEKSVIFVYVGGSGNRRNLGKKRFARTFKID